MLTTERLQEQIERKARKLVARGAMKIGNNTIEMAPPPRPAVEAMPARAAAEAVLHWYRPVLVITDDRFVRSTSNPGGDPRFVDPNIAVSQAMLDALDTNRTHLDAAIPSIGRIELANNSGYPWVGTGWIIDSSFGDDIIVTNAHVAREFGMKSGGRMVFRPGIPDFNTQQTALIDFREELGAATSREFPISEIIWISENPELDIALLRVTRAIGSDTIARPIELSPSDTIAADRMLAVVGYPGSGGGYDPEPFERVFGRVLGKKRFSPGLFDGLVSGFLTYDASTLPGSSGSVVLDVETGQALGLHFAGTAFEANYGVTATNLRRTLRDQPWRSESVPTARRILGDLTSSSDANGSNGSNGSKGSAFAPTVHLAAGEVRFPVPLEIIVRLGSGGEPSVASVGVATTRTDRESVEATAERVRNHVQNHPAILSVRASYLFRDGEITEEYGVIVGVRPGESVDARQYGLGSSVDGVTVSVETADPETVANREFGFVREAFAERKAEYRRDLTDPRFDLKPVTDDMRIVLHVSPEAGWPELKKFFERDDSEQLTIGMYHMTAPHVVQAIKSIADRDDSRIVLTLDRQRGDGNNPDDTGGTTKDKDIPEKQTLAELEALAGTRFKWAPASLGSQGLFASAYHIKVAVWTDRISGGQKRDKAFWLSSGNWQSSNQPRIEDAVADLTWDDVGDYNREWHAIVEHEGLAETFRNHLEQDFEDNKAAAEEEGLPGPTFELLVPDALLEKPRKPKKFRAFEPLELNGRIKVQPLLTPDNYPEVVAKLIEDATERVLIENQSFGIWQEVDDMPDHFVRILDAIKDQQKAGLDVRIIFRSGFGKERDVLRRMKDYGIKVGSKHVRFFDTCHTKGFVIDDNIAILGSQNITAGGTGPNRDASLVIWNKDANKYFAGLFEYDWSQIASTKRVSELVSRESIRLVPASLEAPTPAGFRRVSLAEFLGET